MVAFRELTKPIGGLTFQAQPYSTKQPIQRPNVSRPYQKNMPPLIVCARPLKTFDPRCDASDLVLSSRY